MKKVVFSALLLLLLINPTKCFSWGGDGHRIMARITNQNLSSSIKDSLAVYLGSLNLEDCSVWMDEVRSDHSFDYLKPCHYINIEKGGVYTTNTEENIINKLNKVIERLKHRKLYSKDEVVIDIKILIHLIGDLHQPLHVGYGVDKGGNTVNVQFLGKETNLHRVWDSEIIKKENITVDTCNLWLSEYSKIKSEKSDIPGWMNEGRAYLEQVYDIQNNTIDQAYIMKNKALIEKQLLKSGLRLCVLMNEIFLTSGK